jgi:hypothetical protein
MLRKLANWARHGLHRLDGNRNELIEQLEAAATDIECMVKDLEMERKATRRMAHEIAILKPPKALLK